MHFLLSVELELLLCPLGNCCMFYLSKFDNGWFRYTTVRQKKKKQNVHVMQIISGMTTSFLKCPTVQPSVCIIRSLLLKVWSRESIKQRFCLKYLNLTQFRFLKNARNVLNVLLKSKLFLKDLFVYREIVKPLYHHRSHLKVKKISSTAKLAELYRGLCDKMKI